MNNSVIYLTCNDILDIHDTYIEKYGGIKGMRDEGLFIQLCEAPYQSFAAIELFPSVYDKAAKYLDGFAKHQVFLDGNKRTAAGTMSIYLELNGFFVAYKENELASLTLDVANDILSFDDIVESIRSHVYSS